MAQATYVDEWLEPEGILKIEGWARAGATETEIAKRMDICRATLWKWKKKYPKIEKALKLGKEVVDFQVENALLKRALGYKYTEVTKEPVKNTETGQYELQITKEVVKEVAPDTTAQIFWLKNRKPDEWRNKPEMAVSFEIEDLTPLKEALLGEENEKPND
jgi:transposase-like protein